MNTNDKDPTETVVDQEQAAKLDNDFTDFSDFDNTEALVIEKESGKVTSLAEPDASGTPVAAVEPSTEGGEELTPELLEAVAKIGESEPSGPMIPKARFDERTGELKDKLHDTEQRLAALEAQQKSFLTPPGERDFAAEKAALKSQYQEGGMLDDDYQDKRDALILEEAEHRALIRHAALEQQRVQQAAQLNWDSRLAAWKEDNAEFLSNGVRAGIVAQLLQQYGSDGSMSDADLLAKVEQEAYEAFNFAPKVAGAAGAADVQPVTPPANPHADRNRRDAIAQAQASNAASLPSGGVGNRGQRPGLPGSLTDATDVEIRNALSPELLSEKSISSF